MVKDLEEDTNVLTPKTHPSLMDVIDFKREVINALTLCDLRGDPSEHPYILENAAEYNLRNQTVIAKQTTQPLRVVAPDKDAKSWE